MNIPDILAWCIINHIPFDQWPQFISYWLMTWAMQDNWWRLLLHIGG